MTRAMQFLGRAWRRTSRKILNTLGLATGRELRHARERQRQTVNWLVEHALNPAPSVRSLRLDAETLLLVSVVMPVWNRADVVAAAIDSVIAQTFLNWELLIVDDGSTDDTIAVVSRYLADPRIRLLAGPHVGVSAARNRGLTESRGELIGYLDSDNSWFPHFLTEVVAAFDCQPDVHCVYAAQLVENSELGEQFVRAVPFDRERYVTDGGIDLNVFAHRRGLFEKYGGFDERLTRLVDWELIVRYTEQSAPRLLPTIGGRYFERRPDSISATESLRRNRNLLHERHRPTLARDSRPLRVLWAVWNYPQLTETYIRCELAAMRRWGVEVEVWSEIIDTKSPYASDVPVHHGSLAETIARVRPDIVHVHWLNKGKDYLDTVRRAGLPLTVRGHSYEFATKSVKKLLRDSVVRSVYLFPHFARQIGSHPKIRPMTSAFNEDWFYPAAKDRRLVLRAGAGKPTKGLESFLEIASRCPDHRFVLVLGLLPNLDDYVERLLAENRRLGSPAEIRINLSNEDASALVRQAGIYLHTYGDEEPFGMPVSIAEAMATGAITLARDLPGVAEYLATAGVLYRSTNEAVAFIQNTLNWTEADWQSRQQQTIAIANQNYASELALRPILEDWLSICERTSIAPAGLRRAA